MGKKYLRIEGGGTALLLTAFVIRKNLLLQICIYKCLFIYAIEDRILWILFTLRKSYLALTFLFETQKYMEKAFELVSCGWCYP